MSTKQHKVVLGEYDMVIFVPADIRPLLAEYTLAMNAVLLKDDLGLWKETDLGSPEDWAATLISMGLKEWAAKYRVSTVDVAA
jgi:hypothetical protein